MFTFRSDPVVQRYNGGAMSNLAEAAKLIEEMDAGLREGTKIHWVVTVLPGQAAVGLFGFANWSHKDRRAEIGYCLHRDYWGRGLALEAMERLIEYGFREMDLNRISACTWLENVASIKLIERAGFIREGVLREEFFAEGSFHDEAHYSLLRREFRIASDVSSSS